jgi:hypothetical protein
MDDGETPVTWREPWISGALPETAGDCESSVAVIVTRPGLVDAVIVDV